MTKLSPNPSWRSEPIHSPGLRPSVWERLVRVCTTVDPAIEQLHRASEIDPNFWFSHCFLGELMSRKESAGGIVEFQRAVELEKDNARPGQAGTCIRC